MRVAEMNWMQLEALLREDDRAVLPLGSVEQHAFLSLATDAVLAERVAVEAAEPLGIPVFPLLSSSCCCSSSRPLAAGPLVVLLLLVL